MADGHVLVLWWILFIILLAGDVEKCPGPRNEGGLYIGHQNIRGLAGKIDLLSLLIHESGFNLFGVTETFMTESTPTLLVNIDGFIYERKDRVLLEEVLVYTLTITLTI